ncbi:MAG TPA: M48 family metalloprotease [Mycobacteriales bacterium]|nr:M48 family metalloprotease [Mycobacteriales bacterium]
MVIRLRAMLAIALLPGPHQIAFALIILDLLFSRNLAQAVLLLLIVMAELAVFVAIWRTVRRKREKLPDCEPWDSVEVTREEMPALWGLVDQVAAKVGTAVPAKLFLTAEANALAREKTRLLGLVSGKRWMYVGVPFVMGLSADELRFVIGHELGHFAGRHTQFGAAVYRGAAVLGRTSERLLRATQGRAPAATLAKLTLLVFDMYKRSYDWVSLAVRRKQEFEADTVAARIVGRTVAEDALRKVHVLPAAWKHYSDKTKDLCHGYRLIPDEPFLAFSNVLTDPGYRAMLAGAKTYPPEQKQSAGCSHPPLALRLATVGKVADSDVPPTGTPPVDVTSISPTWLQTAQQQLFARGDEPLTILPYQNWLDTVAELTANVHAGRLVQAADRLTGHTGANVDDILGLLEAGRQAELASELAKLYKQRSSAQDKDSPPQDNKDQMRQALFALVGQSLVTAGKATWEMRWWASLSHLASKHTSAEELWMLMDNALNREDVAGLRLHLASVGVALDTTVLMPMGQNSIPLPSPVSSLAGVGVSVSGILVILALFGAAGNNTRQPLTSPTIRPRTPIETYLPRPEQTWYLPPINPRLEYPLTTSIPIASLLGTVTVRAGDTLSRLACRYGTTVAELQKLNDLGTSTRIFAGQLLYLPESYISEKRC